MQAGQTTCDRHGTNSLSLAKQHLFENSSPPITPLDSSVTIQNWPGEPRECVEIVRGIQAEAERGVPLIKWWSCSIRLRV